VQGEVEGAQDEEDGRDDLVERAVVVEDVHRGWGEASRAPGRHVNPQPVEEGPVGAQADGDADDPQRRRAHGKVDQAYFPDGLGGVEDAREEPLVLAFADVELVSPA
jgi:hypothetical protein